MPDYKHRKIELTPRRHKDGTWNCPYRVIEFRPTSWAYHKGCAEGRFASREEAAAAALDEAKRIIDALEAPAYHSCARPDMGVRNYGTRIKKILGLIPKVTDGSPILRTNTYR
jgi:hypothetical protein